MYYTDKDLAEKFQVSRHSIWRWVREEDFPKPIKLGPQAVRWRAEDVQAWEDAKATARA